MGLPVELGDFKFRSGLYENFVEENKSCSVVSIGLAFIRRPDQ